MGFHNYSGIGTVDPLTSFSILGNRNFVSPVEYLRSGAFVIRFQMDQLDHGPVVALGAMVDYMVRTVAHVRPTEAALKRRMLLSPSPISSHGIFMGWFFWYSFIRLCDLFHSLKRLH